MRSNRSWHPKGSIMHTWKHAHAGLAICLLALAVVSPLQAGTVYVSTTGDDANGGLSWATAKKTVQAGLNAAVAGDQVWVAAGIYVEKIALKSGVALYGGFAGTETELAQRDFVAHATVLDANRSGSAVFVPTGTTGAPRIDGFTLRNSAGQGIDCRSGPVTIANNLITANSSGGIYCNGSSIVIVGNTIKGNSGSSGGGITCYNCSPTIVGNVILGNSADSGGGIYCYKSSSIITNNTIAGNSAATCGGIYCSNSSPTITNTIVAFNSSGIRVYNGGSPALANNCFYGNELYDYSGLTDPTGTAGNVSVDPLLADGAYGNIHLQPGSPCIDAGNDAAVQPGWLDMDRQARTMGLHVDIGADEADGTTWPAGPYVIVRVSPAGSDANDGSSWALAKRTVHVRRADHAVAVRVPVRRVHRQRSAAVRAGLVGAPGGARRQRRRPRRGHRRRLAGQHDRRLRHSQRQQRRDPLPAMRGDDRQQHDHGQHHNQLWCRDFLRWRFMPGDRQQHDHRQQGDIRLRSRRRDLLQQRPPGDHQQHDRRQHHA
jgi:hypothetical protein